MGQSDEKYIHRLDAVKKAWEKGWQDKRIKCLVLVVFCWEGMRVNKSRIHRMRGVKESGI